MRELGVDVGEWREVADLASVGMVWIGWRGGPVEDWHAVPWCRIDTPELVRASVATTRAVRGMVRVRLPEQVCSPVAGGESSEHAYELLGDVGRVIADPGRVLPDGRTVAEVAPSEAHAGEFVGFVDSVVRRWAALAFEHGLCAVVLMLASVAARSARHWWGTPWWPVRVEEFLRRLDDPDRWGDPLVTAHVRLVRERLQGIDRRELRRELLVGPDRLDPTVLASCLSAGLGDGLLVDRPRVAGTWFRDVAALLEPETPTAVRSRAEAALTMTPAGQAEEGFRVAIGTERPPG